MTLASLHLHFISESRIRADNNLIIVFFPPSIVRPWFSFSKSHTLFIKKQVYDFFSFILISSVKITQTKIIILSVTDKHNFLNILFSKNFAIANAYTKFFKNFYLTFFSFTKLCTSILMRYLSILSKGTRVHNIFSLWI